MAGKKLTVVISQQQGKNPVQRHLEEEIAVQLLGDPDIDVSLVPHLYDLSRDHTGTMFLQSVPGNLLVLSWLFSRAARWILDRNGIKGQEGISLLNPEEEDTDAPPATNGIGSWDVPKRKLYCIDLRDHQQAKTYLEEIRRIARENTVQTFDLMGLIQSSPQRAKLQKYVEPEKLLKAAEAPANPETDEQVKRRWYPVIDYSRCTNCMECIDFCLFGVYGLDGADRILVEQQDNCKKGCPACSRVCPENAIMFPGHKTAAIAGAEGEVAGLKIDLSRLFGAPNALEMAAMERDTELVADGREAVGMSVGIPKRQASKPTQRDNLDDLMDGLDQLDM
ncbi:MAG: 2-oxoacid:acceptor oxidoreductase, delta subunit, pyruvate/2-ketoisovalerate family [Planctomycetaceae bacterium]|nr:2-oxoacid:acceptor oxidoreductase, delta subunit, pyruvate/2-ketoisovalerate family [Planctomycetaceae bacterium]